MKYFLRANFSFLILFLFLFLFISIRGNCQSGTFNLEKYWYLKWRLENYFMVIGDGPGLSIPSGHRNAIGMYYNSNFEALGYRDSLLGFGDPFLHSGQYIATLATEYHLLNKEGSSTDDVLKNLALAIKAIDRLDEFESTWPSSFHPPLYQNAKDGLLTRNGPSEKMLQPYYSQLNKNLNIFNHAASPGDPYPVSWVGDNEYDLSDNGLPTSRRVMSQDHIAALFMGFCFVKKFIPPSYSYNGYNPYQEVTKITRRIMTYLISHNWKIYYPDGMKVENEWGGDARGFSYGIAKTALFIDPQVGLLYVAAADGYKPIWDALQLATTAENGCYNFCDIWTNFFNNEACPLRWRVNKKPGLLNDNIDFLDSCDYTNTLAVNLTLAATSNEYGLEDIGISGSTANFHITEMAAKMNWQAYYSLINAVLYDANAYAKNEDIEYDLNTMPCGGPYSYDGFFPFKHISKASFNWAVVHKYSAIPEIARFGDIDRPGAFSGLEYLLLFNLYSIYNPSYIQNYSGAFTHYLKEINFQIPYVDPNTVILGNVIAQGGKNKIVNGVKGEPMIIKSAGDILVNQSIEPKEFGGSYTIFNPTLNTFYQVSIPYPTIIQPDVTLMYGRTIKLRDGAKIPYGSAVKTVYNPLTCNLLGTAYEKIQTRETEENIEQKSFNKVSSNSTNKKQTENSTVAIGVDNSGINEKSTNIFQVKPNL